MQGVREGFSNTAGEVRIAALLEALKYGGEGLEFLLEALEDGEVAVQWAAYRLLEVRPERKVGERIEKWLSKHVYEFETVKVGRRGEIIQRERGKACYFREELGSGVGLDVVYVPGGSYWMGSPPGEGTDDERPRHRVTVAPFCMGKYPVTQAQWRAVAALPEIETDLKPDPSQFKGENRPVEGVNWNEAVEFCRRLARETGKEYRLPGEAEWEYACRAGTETPFHFGETITSDLANYNGSYTYAGEPKGRYRQGTTPVGQFPPNGYGLYDLHGNVWEWCADAWHDNYEGAPADGSAWTGGRSSASVLRGGSWYDFPGYCRSAYRDHGTRDYYSYPYGFRVACAVGRTP
jgi:formylglycine-generating enzyme required for sulfatase activity